MPSPAILLLIRARLHASAYRRLPGGRTFTSNSGFTYCGLRHVRWGTGRRVVGCWLKAVSKARLTAFSSCTSAAMRATCEGPKDCVLNIVGVENFRFAEGPDAHGDLLAHRAI